MKKVLLFSALLLPAFFSYVSCANAVSIERPDIKIGFVNVKAVLDSCAITQGAMINLQMEIQSRQAGLSKEEEEIANLQRELQDKAVVLGEDEKKKRQVDIDNKTAAFKNEAAYAQQEFAAKQTKVNEYILKIIRDAAADIAKKEGFSLILDKQNVLYGANIVDLTEKVVEVLNELESKN